MTEETQQGFQGQQQRQTPKSEYGAIAFVCQQLINKMATIMLVRVEAVSNSGGVSAVGTVKVLPLVNQISGDAKAQPHAAIVNVPYFRMQGGANAVILDPQVGDIGMCAFAMRDISAVKSAKAPANPGSFRKYDWADALYLGGFLNGVPSQFVQFSTDGIRLKSPTAVILEAPAIELRGPVTATETIDASGEIHSDDDVTADNISLKTHTHSGVTPGGGNSGGPNP